MQGSHGYWHPFQQGKTNLLIQTTAGVLEKKECVNLLPFMTQIRIGLTVNDRARFCAQIPSQEILLTMVKLSWTPFVNLDFIYFCWILSSMSNSAVTTVSHLFCTLISENQGLDKSRSVSNLIKSSVSFSFCHMNFFQVYGTNLKKIQLTNWKKFRSTEKKFRCAGPEIFLRFETDLNFSRPWFSEMKVQIKWPSVRSEIIL